MRIYGSPEVHHTIQRAAGVLGLGRHAFTAIESDVAGRIDPVGLDRRLRADRAAGITPMAIVAVAGIDLDRRHRSHRRDRGHRRRSTACGCTSTAPTACRRRRSRNTPIDSVALARADSMIVDPHKWLGTPVGCGATYVRDGSCSIARSARSRAGTSRSISARHRAFAVRLAGHALVRPRRGVAAPARGVWVWATLREIGARAWSSASVGTSPSPSASERIADEHDRLELMLPPELSVCCFRYRPLADLPRAEVDAINETIVQRLRAETPYVPSTARVRGDLAIRTCFVNAATSVEDIDGLAAAVVRLGDELMAGRVAGD